MGYIYYPLLCIKVHNNIFFIFPKTRSVKMTKGVIGPNKKDSKNSEKLQNCLLKLENVLHNRWRLLQHSSMNSVLSLIWAVLTGSALYQLKSSLEQQCDCSEIDFREICQGRVNQQVIILRTTFIGEQSKTQWDLVGAQKEKKNMLHL